MPEISIIKSFIRKKPIFILSALSKKMFLIYLLLQLFFISCTSLKYVTGVYGQSEKEQIDFVVKVQNKNGIALTDLTLNDFYVKHNNQRLERKNQLRLNETLSIVKLYMVVLIDLRKNPEQENNFERNRKAFKAYLTLQPQNIYIKLISYDTEARVLNDEFSNDKIMLQKLLQDLEMVQTSTSSGLQQALDFAQSNIDNLPNGAYALKAEVFDTETVRNATEPLLYNSAVLLLNHNSIDMETLQPYYEFYNFVVLDTTDSLGQPKKKNSLAPMHNSNGDGVETILGIYKLPSEPSEYLNKDISQSRAVKLVNQAWDSLNNIVNGYYWLTYHKYTDMNKLEPNSISVSLTQYGRSTDVGWLLAYEKASLEQSISLKNEESILEGADALVPEQNENVDSAIDEKEEIAIESSYALDSNINQNEGIAREEQGYMLGMEKVDSENNISLENLEDVATIDHSLDLAPPAIAEPEIDTLALLPSERIQEEKIAATPSYPEDVRIVVESPIVDDFVILSNLGKESSGTDNELINQNDNVQQYTAEPIQLVSTASSHEMVEPTIELIKALPEDITNGRYIQVGAFTKLENLYNVIERLSEDYSVQAVTSMVNGKEYNRCIVGPLDSKIKARKVLQKLKARSGLYDAFIIRKPIAEWIGE